MLLGEISPTNLCPKPVGPGEKLFVQFFALLLMSKCSVLIKLTVLRRLLPLSPQKDTDWSGHTPTSWKIDSDRRFSRWICEVLDLKSRWLIRSSSVRFSFRCPGFRLMSFFNLAAFSEAWAKAGGIMVLDADGVVSLSPKEWPPHPKCPSESFLKVESMSLFYFYSHMGVLGCFWTQKFWNSCVSSCQPLISAHPTVAFPTPTCITIFLWVMDFNWATAQKSRSALSAVVCWP